MLLFLKKAKLKRIYVSLAEYLFGIRLPKVRAVR
jgi:hypothetical protein